MGKRFRVSSDESDFEAVLEIDELVEVEVARDAYDEVGLEYPDREFAAQVVRCQVTRVEAELAGSGDVLVEDLRSLQPGAPLVFAQFGAELELHCVSGAYDVGTQSRSCREPRIQEGAQRALLRRR